jgi:hypothetical protein
MKPNPDMVKNLLSNKCKVAFKADNNVMYIMIDYKGQLVNSPNQGLEVWGRSQEIFEKVASTVRKYYPFAELSSQNGSNSVVYRIAANVSN